MIFFFSLNVIWDVLILWWTNEKIKCFYNIRVHVWDLGCYYQTTSCQPINYRQFVPQKQTVTNGVVGLCWRWCFPFKIKPLIYIFLLQRIKKNHSWQTISSSFKESSNRLSNAFILILHGSRQREDELALIRISR